MRYGNDLRDKVVNAINKSKYQKSDVSKMFGVSRVTIDKWLELVKTGGLHIITPRHNRHLIKLDRESLHTYLKTNPDKFQYEIASIFKVSEHSVWYNMQKLGISRKKNKLSLESEVLKDEKNS
jgi:transposase